MTKNWGLKMPFYEHQERTESVDRRLKDNLYGVDFVRVT